MNNPTHRDERIDAGMKALEVQLAKARRHVGPDSAAMDELRSAGHEAVTKAYRDFDPARGVPWGAYVTKTIHYAFLTLARDHKRAAAAGRIPRSLSATNADGDEYPLPADPKAADPADIAAAREASGPGRAGLGVLVSAPTPAAARAQAVRLRAAMFKPLREADLADVMAAVVARAKAGDPHAARLVFSMVNDRANAAIRAGAEAFPADEDRCVVYVDRADVT